MVQQEFINQDELRKAVKAIVEPGHVFEVRVLANNKKNPASGYFTDADTLLRALEKFDLRGRSVYLTLNELSEDLYDREQRDRLLVNMTTTSDADVTAYRWLFIDLDPNRAAGVSSTEEELDAAKSLAGEVRSYMSGLGFSNPVFALSGNGCHLLYRIDLPNTQENRDVVKRCLENLAAMFNNEAVKIDTVNFNPSRICKLHGTLAQKGSNTKKRPHRFSRIVECDDVTINSKETLLNLAGTPPEAPKAEASPSGPFDIIEWMNKYGIQYKEQTGNGYRKFVLQECPFDSSHKYPDSMITQGDSGAIGFRCLHNSCQGKTWKDVRLKFEPDAYDKRAAAEAEDARIEAGYAQHKMQKVETQPKKKEFRPLKSAADLMKKDIPDPIVYIGTDSELPLLVEGTCILSAKPKMGKSWLALAICYAVTKGVPILGYNTRKCSALYLDLETSENIQQKRIKKMIDAMGDVPENLYIETETDSLENGFCDQIEAYMKQDPNIGVVIVDVFQVIRSTSKSTKETEYDHAYRDLTPLNNLALKYHISIILVTHDRKQPDLEDPFANILGSTGLQGAATQMMVLYKTRKDSPIHLSVKGKTIDGVPEFCVKFEDGVWSQTQDSPDAARLEEQNQEYLQSDIRTVVITILERESNWYGSASDFIAKAAAVGIGLVEDAKMVGGFLTKNVGPFMRNDGVLITKIKNGSGASRYRISRETIDINGEFEKNVIYF